LIYDELILHFIMLPFIEIFRWVLRLFRLGRICNLRQFVCWISLQCLPQPGMSDYYWVNWQGAGSQRWTFQSRITGFSITSLRNKYLTYYGVFYAY